MKTEYIIFWIISLIIGLPLGYWFYTGWIEMGVEWQTYSHDKRMETLFIIFIFFFAFKNFSK